MSNVVAVFVAILMVTSFEALARGQTDAIAEPPPEELAAVEDVARLDRWLSWERTHLPRRDGARPPRSAAGLQGFA